MERSSYFTQTAHSGDRRDVPDVTNEVSVSSRPLHPTIWFLFEYSQRPVGVDIH
jgi:hypothetical protein